MVKTNYQHSMSRAGKSFLTGGAVDYTKLSDKKKVDGCNPQCGIIDEYQPMYIEYRNPKTGKTERYWIPKEEGPKQ